MSDISTPAAAVTDVGAQLDSSKAGGAAAYLAKHDELVAAGHAIPYSHGQSAQQIRDTIGRVHSPGGPISPRHATAAGDTLVARGMAPDRVREILAADGVTYEPDTRTPAQKAHDAEFGMGGRVRPEEYAIQRPAGFTRGAFASFEADARDLASSLALQPETGRSLSRSIAAAASELGAAADPKALQERWQGQLEQLYPGPKLREAQTAVDAMLKEFAKEGSGAARLVARLREHGAISNPYVFGFLRSRALTVAAWRDGRPK